MHSATGRSTQHEQDEELEREINAACSAFLLAPHGSREKEDHLRRMGRLIAQSSPGRIAQMEYERGLRV